MVAILSVVALDFAISFCRSSIVRISMSLYFVRYPLRRVERQRGILAIGVPGINASSLFPCMLLSYLSDNPSVAWEPLSVIGMLKVLSIGLAESVI